MRQIALARLRIFFDTAGGSLNGELNTGHSISSLGHQSGRAILPAVFRREN